MKYQSIKSKLIFWIPVIIFVFFTVWWFYLRSFSVSSTYSARQLWGATYQILALYGGIVGLFVSKKWGGYKSLMGKIILVFSIGLLLQVFGQSFSSWYVYYYKVESPAYPSLGDIGFFGSVLAYIYGIILLARASGATKSLEKIWNKAWAIVIIFIVLILSYFFFLKGYQFDWSQPIKVFLDFGYPFGQAFYVSIAILVLLMSRNLLGGVMKKPITFLIFALIFQYASDFFFLYQSNLNNWYVGNINDYMYAASYLIMSLSLIQFGAIFEKIKNS